MMNVGVNAGLINELMAIIHSDWSSIEVYTRDGLCLFCSLAVAVIYSILTVLQFIYILYCTRTRARVAMAMASGYDQTVPVPRRLSFDSIESGIHRIQFSIFSVYCTVRAHACSYTYVHLAAALALSTQYTSSREAIAISIS
jgi:hypothetical protein